MSDDDDDFTPRRLHAAIDQFNASLLTLPLRRGECILFVAGDHPRRMLQAELADELRAAGMSVLARRVERAGIAAGHVLCACVGLNVRVFVAELTDMPGSGERDTRPGASALAAVLGSTTGGR